MEKKAFPDYLIKYTALPAVCIVIDLMGIYKSIGRMDGGYIISSIADAVLYFFMALLALILCGGVFLIPAVYFSRKASEKGYDALWRIPLAVFLIIVPAFAVIHGVIDNAADGYMQLEQMRRHALNEPYAVFLAVTEKPIGTYFLILPALIADDILTRLHIKKHGHDANKAVRYLPFIGAAVCGAFICIMYSNIYKGIDAAKVQAAQHMTDEGIVYLDENYGKDFTEVLVYADEHDWTDWNTCPDESVETSWRRVFFSDTIYAEKDLRSGHISVSYKNKHYAVMLSDDGLEIILDGSRGQHE